MGIIMRILFSAAFLTLSLSTAALGAGAIAICDEEGVQPSKVGIGIGHGLTQSEATALARATCDRANGADSCDVKAEYVNNCAAYAANLRHSGVGKGATRDLAEKNALSDCGDNCTVVVVDCDPGQ